MVSIKTENLFTELTCAYAVLAPVRYQPLLICLFLYFRFSVIHLNCIFYVINIDVLWYAV